jgi:aldehyde:ferredoxin oxidoreductase
MEMGVFEYRAYKGLALANAVSTKGVMGAIPYPEYSWFYGRTIKDEQAYPPSYDKKYLSVWEHGNKYAVIDMLGACKLIFSWLVTPSLEIPARLFSLATGIDTSEDDLLTAAQRVRTLERAFDVMKGITRKDDTLPKRMFETAVPGGRFKGERLDKGKFDKMVDEYYALCGWDDDGIPKEETFNKFGLSSEWQAFKKRMEREVGEECLKC